MESIKKVESDVCVFPNCGQPKKLETQVQSMELINGQPKPKAGEIITIPVCEYHFFLMRTIPFGYGKHPQNNQNVVFGPMKEIMITESIVKSMVASGIVGDMINSRKETQDRKKALQEKIENAKPEDPKEEDGNKKNDKPSNI